MCRGVWGRNDAVLVEKQKIELEVRLREAQRQIQQVRDIFSGKPWRIGA